MIGLGDRPVDSSDVQEQRERDAAHQDTAARRRADADRAARRAAAHAKVDEAVHDARCENGWLGEDEDGRPVPCRACRPHLAHVACRTCSTSYAACEAGQVEHRQACCEDCNHAPASGGAR